MKRAFDRRWTTRLRLLIIGTVCMLGSPLPAWAHGDDDHGSAVAAPAGLGPQRQPDGSVFLPKPAQRQLSVRTLVSVESEWPRTLLLSGRVLMDPNAGGKVQPLNAGRIEPGSRGLPEPGQVVRKGELLAYVRPAPAPLELAGQQAQLAELRAAQALAEQRVARLQALADTVPRKEIEAAQSEAASLGARLAALGSGLNTREALRAPISGVIAAAAVVAGQVVEARELLFEIVDPKRLRIEALAYEPALALDIGSASLAVGEQRVPLQFVGAARSLREQALPLQFSAQGAALQGLAVGQPVRVFVHTRQRLKGVAVPADALMKNPANESIVWVKAAPERYEPRVVSVQALDGVRVLVTAGLKAGERVLTQGAALVNQVR